MAIQIQNARILTPFSQTDGAVLVNGERIVDVSRNMDAPRGTTILDAKNLYLVPGYIDLHVFGGGGHEVLEGTNEAVLDMCNAHAMEGTTTLLPTVSAAPLSDVERAIDAVRIATHGDCDATIAGVHLQGPFLSPAQMEKGKAMHLLSPVDVDWQGLFGRWNGIRMVGLAPELAGAFTVSEWLRERGIVASISHSDAGYDQMVSAVTHGFGDVSNVYTGCSTLQDIGGVRVPGVTECALTMDELTVQLLADGKKLPMILTQMIYRCKGAENLILVTNADGNTTTPMSLLVRNMVAVGASLRVALRMATVNPARRIGLDSSKGRIAEGYDADLLLLDETLNVRFCMSKGRILRNELDDIKV